MHGSLKYLLLVAVLLAGALLFAACGSDDNGGDNGSDGTTTDQPADDGDDNDDDGDDNGDSGDDSGDISDELRALAGQFGVTEVKITYNFSSPGLTDTDPEIVSQMVLYSKPPDRWRMDIISPDGDISMIFDGETTLMCAADGDGGLCFESPAGEDIGVPFLNIFTDPGDFDNLIGSALGVDVSRSTREIAGQDASCFSFSGEIDGTDGSGEYCFRDDGVLLLMRAESGGIVEFSMEAVEVRDSVSDEDLEPPYEVLDLGDLGDIIP